MSVWRGPSHFVAAICALLCWWAPALAGEVAGTVTDDTGVPIAGARIVVLKRADLSRPGSSSPSGQAPRLPRRWEPLTTVTDAEGRFAFADVESGRYVLSASAKGHATARFEQEVYAYGRGFSPRLARGSRITGRITLPSGEPLVQSSATLHFIGERDLSRTPLRTGPDGAYDIVSPTAPGPHLVVLEVSGYMTVERAQVQLSVAGNVPDLDFVLQAPAGSIAGVVYGPDGKTPIPEALAWCDPPSPHWFVRIRPESGRYVRSPASSPSTAPPFVGPPRVSQAARVTTGPDGSFLLSGLPEGTYGVYTYAPGYHCAAAAEDVLLAPGQKVTGVGIVLQRGSEITGTVTDDTGAPVTRAWVRLDRSVDGVPAWMSSSGGRNAELEADGRFVFSDIGPGTYRLAAHATGYASESRDITVQANRPLRVDVPLRRGCRISGRITLPSGEPLAESSARLHLVGGRRAVEESVRTEANGAYTTVVVAEPRPYCVFLTLAEYAVVEGPDVELSAGGHLNLDFVLDSPSGSITGVVYEPDGTTPRADALVWYQPLDTPHGVIDPPYGAGHLFYDREFPDWHAPPSIGAPRLRENTWVNSGPDGSFSLPDLIAATYRVYAYATGYLSTAASEDVIVARGQKVAGVKIALRPAASITGTLYGAKGQPLAMTGLSVRMQGEPYGKTVDVMTDEGGRYAVETLPPDKYSIEVKCEDGGHATLKLTLAEGETATEVDVHLTGDSTLTLRVTDPDGNPAADAEVELHQELPPGTDCRRLDSGSTGPDGRIRFEGLMDGTYWLTVKSPAGVPERVGPIAAQGDEPLPELHVALRAGRTIRGRVVDERGEPVPGASVSAHRDLLGYPDPSVDGAPETSLTTDADGRFVVRHAAPGQWRLYSEAQSHVTADAHLYLPEDGDGEVEMVVPRAWSGTLDGQILMPDGRTPVADTTFRVDLLARGDRGLRWAGDTRVRTGHDGRFSLVIDQGMHVAKFFAIGHTPTVVDIDTDAPPKHSVTVRLGPKTGIRGVVEPGDAEIPPEGLYVFACWPGWSAELPTPHDDLYSVPMPGEGDAHLKRGEREWEIVGLEPGQYEVFSYAPGLAPSVPATVLVREGEMAEVTVDVAAPGAISGRVVTSLGEPIAGINVSPATSGGRVNEFRPGTHTDEEGRYRIEGLTPGQVTVAVYTGGHAYADPPTRETLVVPGDTIDKVDFELFVGGEVTGSVRRPDGKPLAHQYETRLDRGPGRSVRALVNADGTFKLEHVHPGVYDLTLSLSGYGVDEPVETREDIVVPDTTTVGGIELVIDE